MTTVAFKRMVLGLPHSGADYIGIDTAAAMAEALGLDLLAAFVEDPSLLGLASQPFARELRPLGAGWQPVDAARLSQEIQQAAAAARLRFFDRVRTRNVSKQFQLTRGPAADMIASLVQPTDIVVLFEPKHPAERITRQVTDLTEAAFTGASTVLVVPCHIARRHGPIVALAARPDDASVPAAVAVATAAKEHLIVLNASGQRLAAGGAAPARNIHIEERMIRESSTDPSAVVAMLASIKERMLVTSLAPFRHSDLQAIASLRGIPVLVTDSKPVKATTINPELDA